MPPILGLRLEVEALVRWDHPERGLLSPDEFLPLAEETGLIPPIGRFVMRKACCQVREWQGRYLPKSAPALSVNLSARQFRQPDLVDEISKTREGTGLDARSLKLEVTESIAVDEVESTIAPLRELKEMGIALAISYRQVVKTSWSPLARARSWGSREKNQDISPDSITLKDVSELPLAWVIRRGWIRVIMT